MAKWSNEKVADLTRKLADTAIDYKQRCEALEEQLDAALQDAKEAEAALDRVVAAERKRGFWLGRSCGGSKAKIDAALNALCQGGE